MVGDVDYHLVSNLNIGELLYQKKPGANLLFIISSLCHLLGSTRALPPSYLNSVTQPFFFSG